MRHACVAAAAAFALLTLTTPPALALVPDHARGAGETRSPVATGSTGGTGSTSPEVAPRVSLSTGTLGPVEDPLTANGFASPSCTAAQLFTQLDPTARRDCDISGDAVAPVPLSNYGLDTHIASGLDASFDEDLDSIIQGLLVTPVWTALVWLVHVVIVALEWCYSIDLLAPAMMGAVASALGDAERIFTEPWLGLVLTLAGVAFAWNGLVRRRVAETLGQAALMLAMMAVGLWVIADPSGTVGSLSRLADQAALGTVSATATGSAAQPAGGLDGALGNVLDSTITAPWCFLEFGDVNWCRDPLQLDPSLVATAAKVSRLYAVGTTCGPSAPGLSQCFPSGSDQQRADASITLALSAARTNGALFLSLPAGGLARNDLSSETPLPTLYATLCGAGDSTGCTAGTAPQAEFRTAQGTWPRVGGLLLITIGTTGMLLLLGFIAVRLIGAALALLIYLMLAPLAVLAPAFGDGGRATFRIWFVRLVGAALSKLVYSVMLGITLLISHLLTSLEVLGWWTQWLLLSAFWWLAFEHRHRMLAFVVHERGEPASRLPLATRIRYGAQATRTARRTAAGAARTATATVVGGYEAVKQLGGAEESSAARLPPPRAPQRRAIPALAAQVERSFEYGRPSRSELPEVREQIASLGARQRLLRDEEQVALRSGSVRRATSLGLRARAVEGELADHRAALKAAGAGRLGRRAATRAQATLLDRAALRVGPRDERAYTRLAGLANLTGRAYRLAPERERRDARLEIDRQLAQRRKWLVESGRKRGVDDPRQRPIVIGRRARQFATRMR